MHLIIDIRSPSPVDSIIIRYASGWVDLWKSRHPSDNISYLHFDHQNSPPNGNSIIAKSSWYGRPKPLSTSGGHEVFRCINFSQYPPYDLWVETISHIFDHASILYPRQESSWIQELFRKNIKTRTIRKWGRIIVPSLTLWQEAVDILHVRESDINIIPYIALAKEPWDSQILHQLSLSGKYWLYDGSYGSEANIHGLLRGYKAYQDLGGTHTLILMWQPPDTELRRTSELIQKMNLIGHVRIIGVLDTKSQETIYANASGWLYIGAYYAGGPRIELARSYTIPLLISDMSSLSDYHEGSLTIHPNHLGALGEYLKKLETQNTSPKRKITNEEIIKAYEKLIAEKR